MLKILLRTIISILQTNYCFKIHSGSENRNWVVDISKKLDDIEKSKQCDKLNNVFQFLSKIIKRQVFCLNSEWSYSDSKSACIGYIDIGLSLPFQK